MPIGRNNLPSIDSYPLPKRFRERLKRGHVVSGMGIDAMDGVISLKNGKLGIDFDPTNSPVYGRIFDTMAQMSLLSGHKVYVSRRPSTVHPTCGACVGEFVKGGVVVAGTDRSAANPEHRRMGRKRGQTIHREGLRHRWRKRLLN